MTLWRASLLTALFGFIGAAGGLTACNAVLGIDEAQVDDGAGTPAQDASPETSGDGAGGDAAGPTICQQTGEPCWDCTAGKCCAEYAACDADPACAQTLAGFNDCLKSPPDGGETCAEQFAGRNAKFLALTNCTLLDRCFAVCADWPLGNQCGPYCDCMAQNCAEKTFPGGSCQESCPTLSAPQIECRSLHCTFAKGDPMHCDHAVGEAICP